MANELPKYDDQLDHPLYHVMHKIMQKNIHYTNLIRNVNNVSSILARQKYAKQKRERLKSQMEWKTANS